MEINLKAKTLNLKGYCLEDEIKKLEEEYNEFYTAVNYYRHFQNRLDFKGAGDLQANCLEECCDLIQACISVMQKLKLADKLEEYYNTTHTEKIKKRPRTEYEWKQVEKSSKVMPREEINRIEMELLNYSEYNAQIKNLKLMLENKDYDTLTGIDISAENYNASRNSESNIERKIVEIEKQELRIKANISRLKVKTKKIEQCISTFNDIENEFFNLRYLEQLMYTEIQEEMECSYNKLRKIKHSIIHKCFLQGL